MSTQSYFNISSEMFVYKWRNGVKLYSSTPKNDKKLNLGQFTGQSVANILQLPINIYFMTTESKAQLLSDICMDNMGFSSMKDAFGKTMLEVSPRENAMQVMMTDKVVINSQKPQITEDHVIRQDGVQLDFLSFKIPWYNTDNQVTGVFGCSILLGKQPLASSLEQITELGLLQPETLSRQLLNSREIDGIYLTEKEVVLMHQIIRGKTAKEIAKMYGLSFRTIEQRLEYVKTKFGVATRGELIERVVDFFF